MLLRSFKNIQSQYEMSALFYTEVIPRISNNPVPVKQHIGVRKQSRRPYKRTNQHQETAENILMQESTMAR